MNDRMDIARVMSASDTLLIGSMALELRHPELLDHQPRDVDVLVPMQSLEMIVGFLAASQYRLESWGEAVSPFGLDWAKLQGRFYLRATHSLRPTVDLIYEGPVDFHEAWARKVTLDGIHIAGDADLATLYAARNAPGDVRLAQALREHSAASDPV